VTVSREFLDEFLAARQEIASEIVDVMEAVESAVRYALALQLVQQIDRHLQTGTCHYYDTQGRLLTTLDEVVNAILSNTLQ
jgi:uncharacterized protein (DUF924 family)